MNPAVVRRLTGLDDLAMVLFPDNRNHRRAFVAIWLGLKYSEDQFLPSLSEVARVHGVSERTLEIVRAKMSKMGLLKRVSHFSPRFRYTCGWVFSNRFSACLRTLAEAASRARDVPERQSDREKDQASVLYV